MDKLGNLNASEIVYFKYSPITSVDVEQSFLQYKNLPTDERRSLLFENISHATPRNSSLKFEFKQPLPGNRAMTSLINRQLTIIIQCNSDK